MTEENINQEVQQQDNNETANIVDIPKNGTTIVLAEGVSFEINNVKVDQPTKKLSTEQISDLVRIIIRNLERMEIVDNDSAQFEIDYGNRIQLYEVDINMSDIEDEIESTITDFFDDM